MFLCYSLDYFVLVLFAFVVLGLETGYEERLRNIKPCQCSYMNSFTARRYMIVLLSICVSVCHRTVLYRNGGTRCHVINDPLFSKPAVTSCFSLSTFSTAVPSVWNSLEPELRSVAFRAR